MLTRLTAWGRSLRQLTRERAFWILAGMLGVLALLHYVRPPITLFSGGFLGRHAVERIVFLLPVAGAAFAYGRAGGLIVLAAALLIMLPRALWVSTYPSDALLETLTVGVVGYLVIWMVATQEREKRLRQEAVLRLRTLNAICANVTRSLELEQILDSALDKMLEVTQVKIAYIYLVDRATQELVLTAHRGLPADLIEDFRRVRPDQGLSGQVVQTKKPLVVADLLDEKQAVASLASTLGVRSFVAVPLMARDRVVGVLDLADVRPGRLSSQDAECLSSVGNAIGVAVENSYLYQSMRYYVQQITRAQEDERARIARELHDDTIQSLIVLSRQLDVLAKSASGLAYAEARRLQELQKITEDVMQGIRRFSRDLRPSTLDDLGLIPTLEGMTAGMTEKDGIPTALWVTGEKRRLPPEVELTLFRIAQEALTNVKKHASASQVAVTVEFTNGTVEMTVQDDGKGFMITAPTEELAASGHLGLIGMHERARLLGGRLMVQSRPGLGTKVAVSVPVALDREPVPPAR